MRVKINLLILSFLVFLSSNGAVAQKTTVLPAAGRTITVVTEPNAIVWIDDVRRGTTDDGGKLIIKTAPAGVRKLRVRADGFKEAAQVLTAAQKGEVKITLVKTTDEAELAFQQAEAAVTVDREKAVELTESRQAASEIRRGAIRLGARAAG